MQVLPGSPSFGGAWRAGSPDPVGRLLESGADRNLVQGYLQHQWFDDEATAWALQGIEADDAYSWYELGLTAAEAGRLTLQSRTPGDVIFEWWGAGIPLGEVADWIGAGLSATEAVEQRTRGITAEHAAALRALRQDDDRPQQGGRPGSALRARKGPPSRERIGPPRRMRKRQRAAIVAAFGGLLTRGDSNAVASVEGGSNLGDCVAEVARRWGATGEGVFVVTVEVVRFVNEKPGEGALLGGRHGRPDVDDARPHGRGDPRKRRLEGGQGDLLRVHAGGRHSVPTREGA